MQKKKSGECFLPINSDYFLPSLLSAKVEIKM